MKNFKTLTIATLLSFAACGAALAQSIVVHERPADSLQPADQGLQKVQKVTPTDQPTNFVGQVTRDDPFFQPAGQGSQKVQKVTPTDQPAIQAFQSPTDRGSERAGDIAIERATGVAGQVTRDDPFFQPGQQKVQKAGSLGSLTGLGSTTNLFENSRGGDQGNGLLLPAVKPALGGAVAGIPGKGAIGTPDTKGSSFSSATPGSGSGKAAGVSGGAALHLKPLSSNAASTPAAANGLGVSGIAKK